MLGIRKRQREQVAAASAASAVSAASAATASSTAAGPDPNRRSRPNLGQQERLPARHLGYSCAGCNEMPILGVRHLSLARSKNDTNYVAPSFCSRCILGPLGADYAAVRVPRQRLTPLHTAENGTKASAHTARAPPVLTDLFALLQDHGPYFKEILPPTGGRVLGSATPGNELMDLLTTSEDVIDTLMKHLSPKDL